MDDSLPLVRQVCDNLNNPDEIMYKIRSSYLLPQLLFLVPLITPYVCGET
jgi:hypothetical protein